MLKQEDKSTGLSLPIMEQFYTIQGEGYHSGRAAYFIRLGGCDVGCTWCDVKESWDAAQHPVTGIQDLLIAVQQSKADYVVITGGEPAMYNLEPLTNLLNTHHIETGIETSGAYPLTGNWHWICLSPKKFKEALPDVFSKADELKVIVYNKHDLSWALEKANLVSDKCKLYLQPEWSKEKEMLPLIIEFVKQHSNWKISLQTHKYMNIP